MSFAFLEMNYYCAGCGRMVFNFLDENKQKKQKIKNEGYPLAEMNLSQF